MKFTTILKVLNVVWNVFLLLFSILMLVGFFMGW